MRWELGAAARSRSVAYGQLTLAGHATRTIMLFAMLQKSRYAIGRRPC
ncbi:MAG: hypothetical protein F6K56_31220 [Moorea sp. SIO3G5]|nr:hypothetical protein [Moorena sp. SIO3G5]